MILPNPIVYMYVQQKIYKINLVVLEIWKAEFNKFTVPVHNKLVCYVTFVFLAADTLLRVLIPAG